VLNDTIGFNKKDQNMGQTGKKTWIHQHHL
jgi:hypothetical protein